MAQIITKNFKTILNKYKYIDSWFWCRYSINPYNGCQFGCIYCDARSQKYHLPTDFENKIIVKTDIKSKLDKRIANARTLLPDVVVLSGTTDPYQAVEKKYKNTRQILEVLLKYGYPVHICTKSTLVLRDLDLLEEIGKKSWCTVSVTITTSDKRVARFLEKLAPPPDERFNVIKHIKEDTRHIQSGVLMIPTIPYLTDDDKNLEKMITNAIKNRADYLMFGGGLTLRDLQGSWFLKHLLKDYPHLMEKYQKLFHFQYANSGYNGNYEPHKSYLQNMNLKILRLCKENNLRYRLKRYIPADYRNMNYYMAEKFLNTSYRRQIKGENWKKSFWAGQSIQNLKEPLSAILERGELSQIDNIDKEIENYLIESLAERK